MIRLPQISKEEKQYLQQRGYTPWTPEPISSFYRPLSWQYQLTNLAILGVTVPLRLYFKRQGYLYFPFSLLIVSIPLYNLLGMTRWNSETEGFNLRRSKEHMLEHLPKVTRQAYRELEKELTRDIEERERENNSLRERITAQLT